MANLFKFAESILNNLDSSTQTALSKTPNQTPSSSISASPSSSKLTDYYNNQQQQQLTQSTYNFTTSSSSSDLTKLKPNATYSSFTSTTTAATTDSKSNRKTTASKNQDDELLEFLNSQSAPTTPAASAAAASLITRSITPSKTVNENDLTNLKYPFNNNNNNIQFESPLDHDQISQKHVSDNESEFTDAEIEQYRQTNKRSNKSSKNQSDVEFIVGANSENEQQQAHDNVENKQLRKEIISLNNEIKSLLNRVKLTEDEFHRSKRKIDHFQSQISESDKIIRELRAREEDLNESIKAKDSQLAVLRVRYDEIDKELKTKRYDFDLLRVESERILKDHSNSSDIQSQAFETLKQKLSDLEIQLEREKEAYASAQREHLSMQNKLETEKHDLQESLQAIEKKYNDEKSKINDLNNQIKQLKSSNNNIKQELEEYKAKATKILQSKDKLIASLKDGVVGLSSDGVSAAGSDNSTPQTNKLNVTLIEIEELKNERDYLKEDLQSKNVTIELLRTEIQELEAQTSNEMDNLRDQLRNMQETLNEETHKKDCVEADMKNLRQELTYAQEELYKQKTNLNSRLQEREKEIEKLRNQLTAKTVSTTTEKELEDRLHSLTESLIQKQTLIEALQSEKHSLFLQLERSEKRLQDYENIVSSRKTTVLNLNDEDETISKQNPYFRESPYDHEVTRKVKRAVTEIDKFGIRLGVFLKRYPIARVFVILYMVLLHLWVLIVLFTYKPEIHTDHTFSNHPNGVMPKMQ